MCTSIMSFFLVCSEEFVAFILSIYVFSFLFCSLPHICLSFFLSLCISVCLTVVCLFIFYDPVCFSFMILFVYLWSCLIVCLFFCAPACPFLFCLFEIIWVFVAFTFFVHDLSSRNPQHLLILLFLFLFRKFYP